MENSILTRSWQESEGNQIISLWYQISIRQEQPWALHGVTGDVFVSRSREVELRLWLAFGMFLCIFMPIGRIGRISTNTPPQLRIILHSVHNAIELMRN